MRSTRPGSYAIDFPGCPRLRACRFSLAWTEAAGKYADLFWQLTWAGLACAVIAFLAVPALKRGMHGVK